MVFTLFDSVKLLVDLPDKGLKAGTRGAIVEVFDKPTPAYIVEFFDRNGETIDCFTIYPQQLGPFSNREARDP